MARGCRRASCRLALRLCKGSLRSPAVMPPSVRQPLGGARPAAHGSAHGISMGAAHELQWDCTRGSKGLTMRQQGELVSVDRAACMWFEKGRLAVVRATNMPLDQHVILKPCLASFCIGGPLSQTAHELCW